MGDDLYVVFDGLPGPNAPSGDARRDLIGRLRQQATAVSEGSEVAQTSMELLQEAARAIESIGPQFVELETADGEGVGPASGVDWEEYAGSNGLHRLGPFRVAPSGEADPHRPQWLTGVLGDVDPRDPEAVAVALVAVTDGLGRVADALEQANRR